MELYYTSFLFGLVAIHGALINEKFVEYGFIIMMGLSILNYAKFNKNYKGKKIIQLFDKTLAHILTIYYIIRSFNISYIYNNCLPSILGIITIINLLYIFHISKLSRYPRPNWKFWAGIIHIHVAVSSILGMLLLQYFRISAKAKI